MSDLIERNLKQTAIVLAKYLSCDAAAIELGISTEEVRSQVSALEERLCLRLFEAEAMDAGINGIAAY